MATWSHLGFQDSASPLMEQLIFFHDHAMVILIVITSLVAYLMTTLLFNVLTNRFLLENQTIEMIWTILPAVILVIIALPSLRLLYLLDEVNSPSLTIKTVGHQWYWSYEYSDFVQVEFDSYMTATDYSKEFEYRLLDVDNRMVVPMDTQIRVLVTAADVIHSWTVPALGVKADAIPGRLNQVSFVVSRPGLFFGQCSEICGANHSFMPIVIESVSTNSFLSWVMASSED
uniref:Cytochrome c oxidase subunit 2 n=1 Tax=Panulirus argus TaxID=6737 RepID=Q9ZXZ2_PANAR|nr:cytochrome c oxidase subunit II [Panulirus argus]AYA51665.1 cytochrome c oxidase subunit II [Panulirus argus]CAB37051.1 cytochrome c oxidase subunit II [Panulirus argus]